MGRSHIHGVVIKNWKGSLANVAHLVGVLSHNRKVSGSIPSQGTYLGCRVSAEVQVREKGNKSVLLFCINVSLSLSLSLQSSEKCPWVRIEKEKELGEISLQRSSLRSKKSQPHTRLPSLRQQC